MSSGWSEMKNSSSKSSPIWTVFEKLGGRKSTQQSGLTQYLSMRSACLCQRHPFIFMPSLNLDLLFTSRRPSSHFIVAILSAPLSRSPSGTVHSRSLSLLAAEQTPATLMMRSFALVTIGKIPAASATHIILWTGCVLKRIARDAINDDLSAQLDAAEFFWGIAWIPITFGALLHKRLTHLN